MISQYLAEAHIAEMRRTAQRRRRAAEARTAARGVRVAWPRLRRPVRRPALRWAVRAVSGR